MPKFSANLSMLFKEVEFLERFERAAKAGFKGVEYLFPYSWSEEQLAERLNKFDLKQVLFNLPAGLWEAGERGIACIPGREKEFQDGVVLALNYAKTLGCKQLNCLVGNIPKGVPLEKVHETLVNNLRFAADVLGKENILLLIEPLNHQDFPDFYLVRTKEAIKLLKEVDHPNIKLQYDVYHMQIMEGNLTKTMLNHISQIGHIQIADCPGRHEPGTGEINFTNLFRFVDEAGYKGWIGCEFIPSGKTEESLSWIKPYL